MAKESHLDFEVQICKIELQAELRQRIYQTELFRSDSRLESLIILSGAVHTGVEVHRMDSEMSRLVERP